MPGIQQHIRRMDITLRLSGSMNLVHHVHPPLDAFIIFQVTFTTAKVEDKPQDIAKSWYVFTIITYLFIKGDETHNNFHVARPSAALDLNK